MSEKIFLEQVVVPGSIELNPLDIIRLIKGSVTQQRARFKTDIVVHYYPNVSSSTGGEVYLAFSNTFIRERPPTESNPLHVGPVWKKAHLRIPRTLISASNWILSGERCPWLIVYGAQGSVTVTCTIMALQYSTVPTAPPPQLVDIDTKAWAGPILAGFSLVFYGAKMPQTNAGGVCMTVDLQNGKGYMTTNLYIRTPETKKYLCVRYGTMPSGCTFSYSGANSKISWMSNSHVIYSMATISSNLGFIPNYYASWAPIHGSTSWWLETRAGEYRIEGVGKGWIPYNMLYLYYDYGDVDIFNPSFVPSMTILPSAEQPVPSPGFKPGETRQLPLNVAKPVTLFSRWWNLTSDPLYGDETQLLDRLAELKQQIVEWPVNASNKQAFGPVLQNAHPTGEEKSDSLPRVRDEGP